MKSLAKAPWRAHHPSFFSDDLSPQFSVQLHFQLSSSLRKTRPAQLLSWFVSGAGIVQETQLQEMGGSKGLASRE